MVSQKATVDITFLSTPSVRRATRSSRNTPTSRPISIHALREEGDQGAGHRRRLFRISIHALREEGDAIAIAQAAEASVFLSTPSVRRATQRHRPQDQGWQISIHALREEGDHRHRRGGHLRLRFLSTPSVRRATAKTERKPSAFVSLYTSLHKLQRDVCKPNRKITPLLAQTAGFPVRSVPEKHVCCRFALAGHQKISTLSWANSGCSPTCSTFVW